MTDRELLELAAKAAGYKVHSALMEQRAIASPEAVALALSEPGNTWWNPLDDDGDALRLAVRLKIQVQPDERNVWATTFSETAIEPLVSDDCAAVRRAIVRVAALVGAGMP